MPKEQYIREIIKMLRCSTDDIMLEFIYKLLISKKTT